MPKYYKGFDKDLKCRGFQYEIGGEYREDSAKLCSSGFHACERPLDVFGYYTPGSGSRYCEVELDELDDERKSDDSKVCGKYIKIGAELGIPGLVKAQIEWVKNEIGFDDAIKKADKSKSHHATGDQSAASATGDQSAASATGDQGAASATGYQGAASATGDQSAASATGDQSAASATGDHGAASATGDHGAASATGAHGAASATGMSSVALASGFDGRVMGNVGCAIFAVERGAFDGNTCPIISVAAAIVDGEKIKPDVWYTAKSGEFVEVEGE